MLVGAGYFAASPGRRLAEAVSAGATAQLPCPKGTFSLSGSSECSPCSVGKYAASERATECVSANPGFFVTSAGAYEQEACPEGQHASGSASFECTSCDAGKYGRQLWILCRQARSDGSDCLSRGYIYGDLCELDV